MAYDSAQAQRTYTRFKSRLTRAINSKNPRAVLAEAARFRDYYQTSVEPMPDYWHRWQIAADDAYYTLRRSGQEAARVTI